MILRALRMVVVGMWVLAGCGDDAGSSSNDDANAGTGGPDVTACDYENETVELSSDLVVAADETVRVCQGVTFRAATDVKIQVLGELIAEGTADAPVRFIGTADVPRSWHGLVVEADGHIELTHAEIGGGVYGLFTLPGSSFVVEDSALGTSFKTAVVQSEGMFANTVFKASAPDTVAITTTVTIDDPNGTLTILDASPSITNCRFDGASAVTDLVRVGGNASPTFDRIYLHSAHCGFHTFGGTNTSMRVTNAIFENLSYGIMAFTTKPIIEDSVFRKNGQDLGLCSGATEENAPVLTGNYYAHPDGLPTLDASCFRIGTTDPEPATEANPEAGSSL